MYIYIYGEREREIVYVIHTHKSMVSGGLCVYGPAPGGAYSTHDTCRRHERLARLGVQRSCVPATSRPS